MQGNRRGLSLPVLGALWHLHHQQQNFYTEKNLEGIMLALQGTPMPVSGTTTTVPVKMTLDEIKVQSWIIWHVNIYLKEERNTSGNQNN
jgi:hypothetical protein